jgi:hypothetical protein
MILRFVQGKELASLFIEWREAVAMPLTPTHVEAVMPDLSYFGARSDGGVKGRPPGYDAGTFTKDFFLTLPATPEQDTLFYSFLKAHDGEPYDYSAILGFFLPAHEHTTNHAICSALQTLALRACGWFRWPLPVPAHLINPRDLLLMIGACMEVPGI